MQSPRKARIKMERLRTRHQIMRGIRGWFDRQGFLETETPLLVPAPSPEAQFFPVKTDSGFLITSPEFQMKRLLVGGFEKIYQLARCFRNRERGRLHNPEFTLLEWYRTGEPLEKLTADIEQMVLYLCKTQNSELNIPEAPWSRTTVSELFRIHLDIILDGSENAEKLREKARQSGHGTLLENFTTSKLTESLAYEQIFFQLWQAIESRLGQGVPVFVHDWPLPLASLARTCPQRPEFADRVELYADGMELANGFGELTDAKEQRRRFEQDLENRQAEGRESVPLDEKFLSALEQGMPPSSGMALGVDRLMMWLSGARHIREVLCFAQDEL